MKKILIAGILSISLFAHGESNDPGMKLLAKGENQKALQTFEQECQNGNGWDCGNAGLMLYMGMGVKKNISESKKYYNKGCMLNDIGSCENLAEIAYKEQNIISAKAYFKKVCGMKKYIKNSLDAKTIAESCKKAQSIK